MVSESQQKGVLPLNCRERTGGTGLQAKGRETLMLL